MDDLTMLHGPRTGPIGPADLAWAYAAPGPGRWIRAMMAFTLDGAVIGPDGRSKSISSPLDRAVMAEVRRQSDVILIGAGTFRAERYRPLRAPFPRLAIVSPSLDLPWDEDVFTESDERPIVVTTGDSRPDRLRVAREHADVVVLPSPDVPGSVPPDVPGSVPPDAPDVPSLDVRAVVAELTSRGLDRILCEGGPTLLAALNALELVDEADVTLSPGTTGGGQIDSGGSPKPLTKFKVSHVILAGDGALFTRYLREPKDPTPR